MNSHDNPTALPPAVAELQGLYGLYGFPEKLLQQIWARREFDPAATLLTDGRPIRILDPGRWNLLGGPDFREARIAIAGDRERTGDIELHLHAEDWLAHHHAGDPSYDRVILHVVLFPPPPHHRTRHSSGADIPILPLLAALPRDLESYAADAVVEQLADRPFGQDFEALARLPPSELKARLTVLATQRWHQKVRFARLRLGSLGWEPACHHAALEVLGYRFNRAPMLRIAGRFPIAAWRTRAVDPVTAYLSEVPTWSRQGARPHNHPRLRLEQYRQWIAERPNWPELAANLSEAEAQRAKKGASSRPSPSSQAHLRTVLCGDAVPPTRFGTFICDALLPLLAAHTGADLAPLWLDWRAGDVPTRVIHHLRRLQLGPPIQAFTQGLLASPSVGRHRSP